ncbi:Dual specificity phosphatase [Cinnamomum micranthum f. kanehirae]|uniref:Dual specificity phosphatase n=1 Tax=Cinnamomum micranthum f. kanehirae TaxID=337451 RepID=A0A3S3QKU1_9MAGN|nr:Dual specificity phosphatase [Cinnamomum micranthum f. kanehirae]
MVGGMVGEDNDASSLGDCQLPGGHRRTYWRSASWSSSRSAPQDCTEGVEKNGGQFRRFPVPLTPRSQNCKARSCLPPLQPLSIARRSLDEWPKAGSDDVGEWPQPPTPSGKGDLNRPGEGLKLDLSSFQKNQDPALGAGLVRRDRIAFFDKECSKVAEHIYLGGDAVARNREILKQHGITHVLNCVGFVCPEYFKSDFVYKTLWLQDSPSEDITSILYDVFDYFEDVRAQGGRVLVHCCQGVSRSTSLVIAYLMWREGQSFDDAFQYVKAARGIANPNMGFACQLLQCQKRVHAIPLSPSSLLRMYRMAPHSPYDPLHVVPKMLNDPSPSCLDSRGAFIIHVPSTIYVWVGKNCQPVMERDAKAAALQVVRYERVQGTIVTVQEGEEPSDFWDAFSNVSISVDSSDTATVVNKEQAKSEVKIGVGKKKVDSYDKDFELFHKAMTGGFVPPFSQSGAGHETHLPARESNWSVLRRKFISGSVKEWVSASCVSLCRVYSDSMLMVDADSRVNKIQPLSVETSSSPPYLSPSSFSSDSSTSLKSSSESPSTSPSTSSSSLTPSPASSTLSDSPSNSSHTVANSLEPPIVRQSSKPCFKSNLHPSKGFALSLAQRRGNSSPSLKLPTLTNGSALSSRRVASMPLTSLVSPRDVMQMHGNQTSDSGTSNHPSNIAISDKLSNEEQLSDTGQKIQPHSRIGESIVDGSCHKDGDLVRTCRELERKCPSDCQHLLFLNGLTDSGVEPSNQLRPSIYRWPNLEKVVEFDAGRLDSKGVLLFYFPDQGKCKQRDGILYLWIGGCFDQHNRNSHQDSSRERGEVKEIDWIQVAGDFLALIGMPKDIPIEVVKEKEEPDEFLQLLDSF